MLDTQYWRPRWSLETNQCLLKGMNFSKRPKLLNLQETSCDEEQWKSVERQLKTIGFKAFHTMGTPDSKPTCGAWKRGIITLVSDGLKAKFVDEFTWKNGQFHAIEVEWSPLHQSRM